VGVEQHDFVFTQIERHIFVGQVPTIQFDDMSFFAQYGSKLVHNATFYTSKCMFGELPDLGNLRTVKTKIKQFVQHKSCRTFDSSRRGQSCTHRHIPIQIEVKTANDLSPLLNLVDNAQYIVGPTHRRRLDSRGVRFKIFPKIFSIKSDNSIFTLANSHVNSLVDGRRQNKAVIVIRMLANEVYSARRFCEQLCRGTKDLLKSIFELC